MSASLVVNRLLLPKKAARQRLTVHADQETALKQVSPFTKLFLLYSVYAAIAFGFWSELNSVGASGVNPSPIFAYNVWAQDGNLDLSGLGSETEITEPSLESDFELPSTATPSNVDAPTTSVHDRTKFFELVRAGGWIGVILLFASIVAVSLIIRLCLKLRRNSFAPFQLEQELSKLITNRLYDDALKVAESSDSFLARIAYAGLREVSQDWDVVEKAIEDAATEETTALYRKTEPLSMIGNVAPMLGLLGTVIGMVATFGELAIADAGGRNLAKGIYFALVTTVDGLLVAIPVLVAHSLINMRIGKIVSETVKKVDKLFQPIKLQSLSIQSPSGRQQAVQSERNQQQQHSSNLSGLREVVSNNSSSASPSPQSTTSRPSLSLKNRQ
ncbi:MAG: MotA/TolQ/ExbB proton channel family protein [Thermoguttaceae bacterium]|nr:MotA/TolQ/ExbB proton channel family protein [Thermoguttaceae bacterium]